MACLPPISVFHVYVYDLVTLSSIKVQDQEGKSRRNIHIKQRTCNCVFRTHINTWQVDMLPPSLMWQHDVLHMPLCTGCCCHFFIQSAAESFEVKLKNW